MFFSTPMCSFSTPLCAARRSGLLARYSSDCCFGETLPRDAFLHLIAHWWPIHNARRAPASQLFRLCQVGQYLEPGAICVRRRQWRGGASKRGAAAETAAGETKQRVKQQVKTRIRTRTQLDTCPLLDIKWFFS